MLALLVFPAKLWCCERNQHAQYTYINASQACVMRDAMRNRNEVTKPHTTKATRYPASCTPMHAHTSASMQKCGPLYACTVHLQHVCTDQGGTRPRGSGWGWGCMVHHTLLHMLVTHPHTVDPTRFLQQPANDVVEQRCPLGPFLTEVL